MTSRTVVYVDTSALGALLVERLESDALESWLDQTSDMLVSSDLLEVELRRLAVREGVDQADVTRLLDGVSLWLELNKMAFWGGCCGIPGWRLRSIWHRIVSCRST